MIRNMKSGFSMGSELNMPDIPSIPMLETSENIDTSELSSSLEETPQEIADEESKSSILSFEVFKNGINPDTKDELSNVASTRFTNTKLNSNNKTTMTTDKIDGNSTIIKDLYSYIQEIESTVNELEVYNSTNIGLLDDGELESFIDGIGPVAIRLASLIESDSISDIEYAINDAESAIAEIEG